MYLSRSWQISEFRNDWDSFSIYKHFINSYVETFITTDYWIILFNEKIQSFNTNDIKVYLFNCEIHMQRKSINIFFVQKFIFLKKKIF